MVAGGVCEATVSHWDCQPKCDGVARLEAESGRNLDRFCKMWQRICKICRNWHATLIRDGCGQYSFIGIDHRGDTELLEHPLPPCCPHPHA